MDDEAWASIEVSNPGGADGPWLQAGAVYVVRRRRRAREGGIPTLGGVCWGVGQFGRMISGALGSEEIDGEAIVVGD